MRTVEIRDLDGPNLFLMSPAIKVELADVPTESSQGVLARLKETIANLHTSTGLDVPTMVSRQMETPGHVVVAFEWEQRAFATSLGTWAAQVVTGERSDMDQVAEELREILQREPDEDDGPNSVKPSSDRAKIVAISGTNGKTTTSRLIEFTLRHAGKRTGITSSAGVSIDNKVVVEGDYSGPSGARRVLADPSVEFAVLETARGGLLLRGAGYREADVAVVTNVTADHLGLHGVHSVQGLAEVKAIVARNLKPGGFCVLNANDPYVVEMRHVTPGSPVLFSPDLNVEIVQSHIAAGGAAVGVDDNNNVVWHQAGNQEVVTNLSDIPMTFGGRARHQLENALAAIAALIGLGLTMEQIRDGVAAFTSTAENSKGRLNLFEVNDATVIIDFAHNEAGLTHLLSFGRSFVDGDGRLISVVGTAGDRDDDAFRAIAKQAFQLADIVVLKDTVHYLRGRQPNEVLKIMRDAIDEFEPDGTIVEESTDEFTATFEVVDKLRPNDVLAVMCIEDYDNILKRLGEIGTPLA